MEPASWLLARLILWTWRLCQYVSPKRQWTTTKFDMDSVNLGLVRSKLILWTDVWWSMSRWNKVFFEMQCQPRALQPRRTCIVTVEWLSITIIHGGAYTSCSAGVKGLAGSSAGWLSGWSSRAIQAHHNCRLAGTLPRRRGRGRMDLIPVSTCHPVQITSQQIAYTLYLIYKLGNAEG
jgi:hypothetical protein